MSLEVIQKSIASGKIICPTCNQPVKQFEKYVDMVDSIWDGAGDSNVESKGSKVTLICANGNCPWKERTEYWRQYLVE